MVKNVDEVTTPEAARFLNVTPPHIRLLFYRGILQGEKRGRDLWISKESLIAYQKNRRPAGRPEGSISKKPTENKRGEREREYQRKYKRLQRKRQKQEMKKNDIASSVGEESRGGKKR